MRRSKAERELLRTVQMRQVRPEPPRDVRYVTGVLSWTAPKNTEGITHYNVYAGTEHNLVRQISAGQTFLNDNLSADRVFVTSYNATNDLESVRTAYEASVSPTAALPGATGSITGEVVLRHRSGADKVTDAYIRITGYTVPTGDFDGFVSYLEDPDQSSGTTPPLLSDTANLATTYGLGGPQWSYREVGRWDYIAGYGPEIGPIEQRAEARTVRVYLNPFSTDAGERDLVQAGLPGASASATFVIPAIGLQGGLGEEYCKNPLNPIVTIEYRTSADGVEEYQGVFAFVKPTDPRYASCLIRAIPRTSGATEGKSPLLTGTDWQSGWAPVPASVTYDFWFLGVDADGNVNSIAEGMGNKFAGVVIGPQTGGSIVGPRVVNIPAASFASTIQPVFLTTGVPGVYSGDTIYDTVGRFIYRWDGAAYKRPMNGAGIKLELALDKLTAGEISAGAISTTELFAGEILVGQGGGKPTRFKVVDSLGNMIGFIGDDSGVPYNGAYFKNIRIAPTIATTSPRIDASGSGITIVGATLSLDFNGVLTSIDNALSGGAFAGLTVKYSATPTTYSAVYPSAVGCFVAGIANAVATLQGLSGYGEGFYKNSSGTTTVTINGQTGTVTTASALASVQLSLANGGTNFSINTSSAITSATGASGGGAVTPGNVVEFLVVTVNGNTRKVPLYG